MSQKIVTLCDPHGEVEEHEAEQYRIIIQVQRDGKWMQLTRETDSDLCKEIVYNKVDPLIEMLAEHGHLPPPDDGEPRSKSTSKKNGKREYCPIPGCGKDYANWAVLQDHARKAHGAALPGRSSTPVPIKKPRGRNGMPESARAEATRKVLSEATYPLTVSEIIERGGLSSESRSEVTAICERLGARPRKHGHRIDGSPGARGLVWAPDEEVVAQYRPDESPTVELDLTEPREDCPYCDEWRRTKQGLSGHMKGAHGIEGKKKSAA